jgi:hypothetical protein
MENYVVQSCLEHLKHMLTCDTTTSQGALIYVPKLALHQAIVKTQLLFLDESQSILGLLSATLGTVYAWGKIASL